MSVVPTTFPYLYHFKGGFITGIRTCNTPGIGKVHNLGAPVALGRLQGDFVRGVPVAVHIAVPESPEHIQELLCCSGNFLPGFIQPGFVDEHYAFAVVFVACLPSGHERADGAVRPGHQIESAVDGFIVRGHMRRIGLEQIVFRQVGEGIHVVCDLSLAYQAEKRIRQGRRQA